MRLFPLCSFSSAVQLQAFSKGTGDHIPLLFWRKGVEAYGVS